MNFKDKLIKKLVEVGKKHRILVYPTLALIAVISAISNAVYWGRSNGKRMLASILVMALLITQSLFLTSSAEYSANENESDTTVSTEQLNLDGSGSEEAGADTNEDGTGNENTPSYETESTTTEIVSGETEDSTTTEETATTTTELADETGEEVTTEDASETATTEEAVANSETSGSRRRAAAQQTSISYTVHILDSTGASITDASNKEASLTGTVQVGSNITVFSTAIEGIVKSIDGYQNGDLSFDGVYDDAGCTSKISNLDTLFSITDTQTDLYVKVIANNFPYCVHILDMNGDELTQISGKDTIKSDGTGTVTVKRGDIEKIKGKRYSTIENVGFSDIYADKDSALAASTTIYGSWGDSKSVTVSGVSKDTTSDLYIKAVVLQVTVQYTGSPDGINLKFSSVEKTVTDGGTYEAYDAGTRTLKLTLNDTNTRDEYYGGTADDRKFYKFSGFTGYADSDKIVDAAYTNGMEVQLSIGTTFVYVYTGWNPKDVTFTLDALSTSNNLYKAGSVKGDPVYVVDSSPRKFTKKITDALTFDEPGNDWAISNESYGFYGWSLNKSVDPESAINTDIIPTNKTVKEFITEYEAKLNLNGASIDYTADTIDAGTLYGAWTYRTYALTGVLDNDDAATGGYVLSGTYGSTPATASIGVAYKDKNGEGNFGIKIENTEEIFNKYGVSIRPGTELDGASGYYKSYTVKGDIDEVTESDYITVKVIDLNKKEGDLKRETEEKVYLKFYPKEVTIDADTVMGALNTSQEPQKTYDGENSVSVVGRADVKDLVQGDEGKVYAVFGETAYFVLDDGSADSDAGTGKTLMLKSVTLAGDVARKYTINTDNGDVKIKGRGRIDKKSITVYMCIDDESDTKRLDTTVKYGEANPKYMLYLKDESNSLQALTAADQNAYNTSPDNFFVSVLGQDANKPWIYERDKYGSPASVTPYTVQPNINNTGKNYVIENLSTSDLKGSIIVERDEAKEGVTYEIIGTKSGDYYTNLIIKPLGEYDEIRMSKESSTLSEINSDADIDTADFKDATDGYINYNDFWDMLDGTVQIEMRNSKTGALTTVGTITGLNVDKTGPVLDSVSVDPNAKIKEFKFGAYYRPQDGNNVLRFTFKYKTEGSKCDYLYYYLRDENGKATDSTLVQQELRQIGDSDLYTADITMSVDDYGQLIVYATDEAGNSSAYSVIKFTDENVEAITSNTATPSTYFEWMVENTSTYGVLSVLSDGAPASTSGMVYNQLTLQVYSDDAATNNAVSGVNRVEWTIYDKDGREVYNTDTSAPYATTSVPTDKKYEKYNFTTLFPATDENTNAPKELNGSYCVSAKLYDNAGNVTELPKTDYYRIDSKKPVITNKTDNTSDKDEDEYTSEVKFTFDVTEGDGESGIYNIALYSGSNDKGELLKTWNNLTGDELYNKTCEYTIKNAGTYFVVATDNAGNVTTYTKTFSGVSSETPDAPEIVVNSGTKDETSGWYTGKAPNIQINTKNKMSGQIPVTNKDGVPIHTDYTITVGSDNSKYSDTYTAGSHAFDLDYEGEITVVAKNISASGKESSETPAIFKVDTVKPVISITGSKIDEDGNLVIYYEITDATSGVDTDKVYIGDTSVEVSEPNASGTVSGSFIASQGVTYTISASDIAGNVADEVSFNPLDMTVYPITDITTSSAQLDAKIYIGTYDLSDWYVAYRKQGSGSNYATYKYATKTTDEDGADIIDCQFIGLSPDTVYEYKVYAVTKTSNEVKEYEGSFKTASRNGVAVVKGKAAYAEDLLERFVTYPVYVTLESGGVTVAGTSLDEGTEQFEFTGLPDGAYQITATNGVLSDTAAVTVKNGGVVYPVDYVSNEGVNLELSGLSTSLDVEDSGIGITVDGLEDVYDEDVFTVITKKDYANVADGSASILVTLHARYLNVSSTVSSSEKNAMQSHLQDKFGSNVEVVRYIELYVTKTVTYTDGTQTVENLPVLMEPLTISFPLEDLAGQNVYVARLHSNDDSSTTFDFDWWDLESHPDEITLSNDYVTIKTNQFSLYALYRILSTDNTYTVTWYDGDKNVMKVEQVKDGESATPPDKTPTKTATANYTYTFEKWDTDYSSITGKTDITAVFTPHVKTSTSKPGTSQTTTETPSKTPDGSASGSNTSQGTTGTGNTGAAGTGSSGATGTQTSTVPDTSVTTPITDNTGAEIDISTTGTHFTYLGSTASPKTGDGTPIVVISVLLVASVTGMVIAIRRRKKQ